MAANTDTLLTGPPTHLLLCSLVPNRARTGAGLRLGG